MNSKLLLFGLQRSGTNYTSTLIQENYPEVEIWNGQERSLPTHKHFRLYGRPEFNPDQKYYHNFQYPDFGAYEEHVARITQWQKFQYLIVTKEPLTWYISVVKEAKKSRWKTLNRKGFNHHFLIDYNLFCRHWLQFKAEVPDRIYHLRYEDLLADLNGSLTKVSEFFGWKPVDGEIRNPSKVYKSKSFSRARKAFYRSPNLRDLFSDSDLWAARAHLEPSVLEGLGYSLPEQL
jgi:hypothetical protein